MYYCAIVGLILTLSITPSTSQCPPEEGIYLMLGDECIANGTWFRDTNLEIAKGHDGYIHCVLPNETLNGGQWVKPDGEPVNCMKNVTRDPFLCTEDSPNANITLYLEKNDYFKPTAGIGGGGINIGIETEYKCCLPTACSDPNTNIMTINVFERVYIIDVYVDLPPDITAVPQTYTVHCIVTGGLDQAIIKHYYNDDYDDTELTQSYCATDHDGYSCTVSNITVTTYNTYSDTRDYTVSIEWEGKSISNGVFTQSVNNGDHKHICTAASGAIEPKHKGRTQSMTVRAPSLSPSDVSVVSVSLTSITISWSYPNISDDVVDGYVVTASSINDHYTVVNTTSNSQTTTLDGLLPGTNYIITVRAYQDILGPPSEGIMVTTKDAPPPLMSWSRVSPITSLLDTQYSIECTTSNVHPSLVYWTVNGVKMSNTNYTLVNESNMTYNNTLLLFHPKELGQSMNVTCSIAGSKNNSILLQAPSVVPQIDTITQLLPYSTNITINWTLSDGSSNDINGFILSITPYGPIYEFTSLITHTTITGLMANTLYTITLYTYSDLISMGVNGTINITITVAVSSSTTIEALLTTTMIISFPGIIVSTLTATGTPAPPVTSSTILMKATPIADDATSSVPAIVGGIVGGVGIVIVLILIVIAIVMMVISRNRHNRFPKDKPPPPSGENENEPEYAEIPAIPQAMNHPNRSLFSTDGIPMQLCEPYSLHSSHQSYPHHMINNASSSSHRAIEMQACEAYSSYHRPSPVPPAAAWTQTNTTSDIYY